MKHISLEDILGFERFFRTNLVNGLSGYKPAHLVGTISNDGLTNLALFSSVVHIGANPPLLGFIMRPPAVARHTLENIRDNGTFTINHVHAAFVDKAHYTSAKFDRGESEFKHAGLKPEFLEGFKAPFVAESELKMGLELVGEIPIPFNETILIIGRVLHLWLPEQILDASGNLHLEAIDDVSVAGLNRYYRGSLLAEYPYARPGQFPK